MSHVDGRIEPIIDRLHSLHPRLIDLSLDRLRRLLATLGHPEQRLPPVIHVAGTNGKGSTCAFTRALAEAAGSRVHVYTSPHLVRFNERFRVAGQLVSDAELAATLELIEQENGGQAITVFEVITAAAFQLFAAHPAELCVLEVGLGGRGDATNVLTPKACAITSISIDHRELLGDTLELIAAEKAGIMKPGVPVVTGAQDPAALAVLQATADRVGATLAARFRDWTIEAVGSGLRFTDAAGSLDLPAPSLPGQHQIDNAGIAVASLRAAGAAMDPAGLAEAAWPGRMQRLSGRLAKILPADTELWLDGGHNPGASVVLADVLRRWSDRPNHLVVGMKRSKDAAEFLRPLLPLAASVWAVQEPHQHEALPVEQVIAASGGVARPGPTVAEALSQIPPGPARVLICGSLYLAGEILKSDWDGTGPVSSINEIMQMEPLGRT
jgi:dihydrofolate synthase/folylpolyglutamate synthase